MNNNCDCKSRVNHIKCEVDNCKYHGEQDCCHAEMIEVTPCCDNDSICATFKEL